MIDFWQLISEGFPPMGIAALMIWTGYQYFVARGKRSDVAATALATVGTEVIELRGMFKAANENFIAALRDQAKAEIREAEARAKAELRDTEARAEMTLVKDELEDLQKLQAGDRKKLQIQAQLNTQHAETINRLESDSQAKDDTMEELWAKIKALEAADAEKTTVITQQAEAIEELTQANKGLSQELQIKTGIIDELSSNVAELRDKLAERDEQLAAVQKELKAEIVKRKLSDKQSEALQKQVDELVKKEAGDPPEESA